MRPHDRITSSADMHLTPQAGNVPSRYCPDVLRVLRCVKGFGRRIMEIQAFGYLGVGSTNLDDWSAFATTNIGMQPVDRGGSMRAFRMDDRKQRLFIDRAIEPGTQVFGWEVADGAALDSLAARLEAAGIAVKRESTALKSATQPSNPAATSPASGPARKAWGTPS